MTDTDKKRIVRKCLRTLLYVLIFALFFFSGLLFFSANWVGEVGVTSPDAVIFTLKKQLKGAGGGQIGNYIRQCAVPAGIIGIAGFSVFCVLAEPKRRAKLNLAKKIPDKALKCIVYAVPAVAFTVSCVYFLSHVHLLGYIKGASTSSNFIENHYVDPASAEIVFPENKRNLVYIFMESMETTYMSADSGGSMETNLIPRLTEIARANTHFSDSDRFGGALPCTGTGWTIGAMVGQTSGLPLKVPTNREEDGEDDYAGFLPNVCTIGSILEREGYNQTIIVGSNSEFGGRKNYFGEQGNYTIKDTSTAYEDGILPEEDYNVFWGFEDEKLYQYAKKELTELAASGEPFNLTMLTVDTHYPDGYVCRLCEDEHLSQYENVISCADRQIAEFLSWLEKQDFYDNTTVIISGDHLTMKNDFSFERRTVFNTFINSAAHTDNTHNRVFTSLDIFPTTVAALGAAINGDRLGLGTNLFSDAQTLPEIYGIEKFSKSLELKSEFYSQMTFYGRSHSEA